MYRFKHGKFAGRTMEHVMLRSAPRLYSMAAWAANKPHLQPLVREFDRLRRALRQAAVKVECQESSCVRQPKSMTFALDWVENYLRPGPRYWCDRHGPPQNEEDDDESAKIPIHFDALRDRGDRRSKKAIHLGVLEGLGVNKRPSRITEKFAHRFFADLSVS